MRRKTQEEGEEGTDYHLHAFGMPFCSGVDFLPLERGSKHLQPSRGVADAREWHLHPI